MDFCSKRILTAALALAVSTSGARFAAAWQIGSQPAAQWIPHLESSSRVATLKIDEVIQIIGLKPGMVIADIGSGSGVFTRPFAKAIGPSGKAIAVDIDSALLSYVSESAAKQGIRNIETHLAPVDDPKLSGPILDVAFFHDVFHHIEQRDMYVKNLAKYMKPGGRIVLIEAAHTPMSHDGNADMHRAMHGNQHGTNQHGTMMHKGKQVEMSTERDKADAVLAAAGFKPVQESDIFGAAKFFVIYAKQ